MKALLIDHDDSFTYNLRNWLSPAFSVEVRSHRDLEVASQDHSALASDVDLIVLSPGPKSPADYPHVKKFIHQLKTSQLETSQAETSHLKPSQKVFGVCLGMQIMTECEGGSVTPYSPPLHGKKSKLVVSPSFNSEFNGVSVARYHSLQCVFSIGTEFDVLAVSENDRLPMWVEHRQHPWMGFQFHPESFMTEKPELFLHYLQSWCRR